MIKSPKNHMCEYPAYLFWKLQSRLTKLANHLEKIHKSNHPSSHCIKPEPTQVSAPKDPV